MTQDVNFLNSLEMILTNEIVSILMLNCKKKKKKKKNPYNLRHCGLALSLFIVHKLLIVTFNLLSLDQNETVKIPFKLSLILSF